MTETIGTRVPSEPDGGWSEISLFDSSFASRFLVVQNSAIESFTSLDAAGGIPHCEATLVHPNLPVGSFFRGAGVEIWGASEGMDPALLIRGKIDYVEFRRDTPSDPARVHFQARSAMSDLVDDGCSFTHEGSVADLVQLLCAPHKAVVDCPESNQRVYVNAASKYAALRLLAVTTSSIVSVDRHSSIAFREKRRELKRLFAKQPVAIDLGAATNVHLTDGRPLRKP